MSRKFSVVQFSQLHDFDDDDWRKKISRLFTPLLLRSCASRSQDRRVRQKSTLCAPALSRTEIYGVRPSTYLKSSTGKTSTRQKWKQLFFLIEKAPRRSSKMLIYAGGVSLRSYAHAIPIISRWIESELRATTLCVCRLAKTLRNKTAEEGKNVINVRPILSISHSSLTYIITFDMEISLSLAHESKNLN